MILKDRTKDCNRFVLHIECPGTARSCLMNVPRLAEADVLISEVGPRDGLQAVKAIMCTQDKIRWISALHHAGLREIEVASFVPAKALPQMADALEIVRH